MRYVIVTLVACAAVSLALAGAWVAGAGRDASPRVELPATVSRQSVAEAPSADRLRARPGTREELGELRLTRGRSLRLHTVKTVGGYSCLVDLELPSGARGSTCVEGELFDRRKVLFSVNFEGGPERFSSMVVLGVAAPEIASVSLTRSDGSVSQAPVGRRGEFALEVREDELERGVLPTALAAYGPSGRLVERLDIPVPR